MIFSHYLNFLSLKFFFTYIFDGLKLFQNLILTFITNKFTKIVEWRRVVVYVSRTYLKWRRHFYWTFKWVVFPHVWTIYIWFYAVVKWTVWRWTKCLREFSNFSLTECLEKSWQRNRVLKWKKRMIFHFQIRYHHQVNQILMMTNLRIIFEIISRFWIELSFSGYCRW